METEFITNVSWAGATSHNFLFMIQLIHLLNFTRAPCIERGVTLHNIKSAQGHILIFRLNFQNKKNARGDKGSKFLFSLSQYLGALRTGAIKEISILYSMPKLWIILHNSDTVHSNLSQIPVSLSRVNWINSNCTNRNINILEMIIKRTRRMS